MPEKVKLPKFVCDWLDGFSEKYPLNVKERLGIVESVLPEVYKWAWSTNRGVDNQYKLIEALRNGYEPEPEKLYYVDFGKAFGEDRWLNKYDKRDYYGLANKNEPTHYKTRYTMPEIEAVDSRYKAFAVPVEEVD